MSGGATRAGDVGRGRVSPDAGLRRDRLVRSLDRVAEGRLGLVVAPAGYGKTTLVASWAGTFPGPVAWYRARASDGADAVLTRLSADWQVALPGGPPTVSSLLEHLHRDDDPHLLVIDDVQSLRDDDARLTVERLAQESPHRTAIVIGSRTTPDLDLVHGEVSAHPVVVGEDDLRFRSWEVESLFRDVYESPLLPEDAAALARLTEGWAAALHMFHLSTSGLPPAQRRLAVRSLAGRSRYAWRYLSRQMLAGLSADRSDFLRRTAVFEVLTARRCDTLLGRTDSQQVLEDLVARQALTSTDDGGLTFRYHEVLRRHLEADLEATIGLPALREWYRRAAELLEADGALDEALRVRARAGDWAGVRATVLVAGDRIDSGRESWTGLLPEWLLHDDPWIELVEAERLLSDGQLESAASVARRAAERLDDPRGQERARDVVGRARAWSTLEGTPARRWYEQVAEALRHLPSTGRPTRPAQNAVDDILARPFVFLLRGDVAGAEEAAVHAEAHTTPSSHAALALDLLKSVTAVLDGRQHPDVVTEAVAAQTEIDDVGWFARAACAVRAGTQRDEDQAVQDSARAVGLCDRLGDSWGAAWAAAMAGLRSVATSGEDEHAWLDEATGRLEQLDAHVPAAWTRALGALAQARRTSSDAAPLAREALAAAHAAGCPGAQATALAALGSAEQDSGHLRAARALADETGVTFRPWQAAVGSSRRPHPRLVPYQAVLFGGFDLSTFGRHVELGGLRPRARQLLHILALHTGEPVHRERLAEMLWPEASPDVSIHRLQVAVSSLRRLLEADPSGPEGEVLRRDGLSYVLRLPEGSQVDVHEFTRALHRARDARRAGRADETITALQAALDLYRGDLLPEDGPAEWVADSRESLRTEAAAAGALLARLLAARDPRVALGVAERAVGIDQYNDEAWNLLIHLHRHLGDTAMVQRTTAMYEEVLRDLGVSPGTTRG